MPQFDPKWLARAVNGTWFHLEPAIAVTGVTQDTRRLEHGHLFVALKTPQRDGHDFLEEARRLGAAAALVERPVEAVCLPQLVVKNSWRALEALGAASRTRFPGRVIGVTGSCGKTTFKDLLARLLGPRCHKTEANLNNTLGVPLTLCGLDAGAHDFAVVEAGINEPGEMATMAAMIRADLGVVTTVQPVHLEKLGSIGNIAREKCRLLETASEALIPASCLSFVPFRKLVPPQTILQLDRGGSRTPFTFGLGPQYRVEDTAEGRCAITLTFPGALPETFTTRQISRGVAQTAALALAAAMMCGVAAADIRQRLRGWASSANRGEVIERAGKWFFVDCYNASPGSLVDSAEHFARIAPPALPRLFVLGGMKELGPEWPRWHREAAALIEVRPQDRVACIGLEAEALAEGLVQAGARPAQVACFEATADAAAMVAAFSGAVFLKGSRAYALERLVPAPQREEVAVC